VRIVPSARDEFGQIKDGHIDLRGKLLLFPDLDDILEHRWKSSFFDPWSFGLDALPSLPNPMNRISFLPSDCTAGAKRIYFPWTPVTQL
jgi:hypothetical protein